MLRRVILAGLSTCLLVAAVLSQPSAAQAQTAASNGNCPYWIDEGTGVRPPLGPPGWSGPGGPANVVYGSHSYVRLPGGGWIDEGTGVRPPLGPPGWSGPGGPANVVYGSHSYVLVPCPPTQTAGLYLGGQTYFGLFLGATAITSLPTSSTSGFYTGGNPNGTPVGFAFGGSVFRDFATFGNAPGPFGSFVLSGGMVIDYINRAPLTWSGTCGGAACTGTGNMNEFNYIAELKLTTPVSPGNTVNGYIGAGGATFWPSGTPTGIGGPSFQGSATAPAARIGFGFDHQINQNWSAGAKVGVQFTGSTEYGTSLTGERFHISRKNEVIFGTTLTYTPSIEARVGGSVQCPPTMTRILLNGVVHCLPCPEHLVTIGPNGPYCRAETLKEP